MRSSRAVGALQSSSARYLLNRGYGTVSDAPQDPAALDVSSSKSVFQQAIDAKGPRTDWTKDEIKQIHEMPLMELAFAAVGLPQVLCSYIGLKLSVTIQGTVHRRFHNPSSIQMCTLLNIKTGGCSEDCSYCAQSSKWSTGVKASKMVDVDSVLSAARIAKDNGSTRFCMGAAWRDMRGRKTNLRNIKAMVEGVRAMNMEVCVTLGMIDEHQAKELKEAGLTAYNHNVDTSREFYPKVITTRSYDERLDTIKAVREAGLNVCTGGILGLGEQAHDHIGLIHTVATLPAHPESFPVNTLVPIKGTPLGDNAQISFDKTLRTIATARIVMPKTIVRIAAGRTTLSEEQQVLAFMAGANAVFTGEKMLTTPAVGWDEDRGMFERWGLRPMESFEVEALREDRKADAGGPVPSMTRTQQPTQAEPVETAAL